ncbi:MAG: glycerate kinase [Actinomycetota bacterium]|nr:glycerate kinase [Actinomycetota bacterium]
MPVLVAAADKFRGTLSAADAVASVVRAAHRVGWDARSVPLSDGGEGFLDVLTRLAEAAGVVCVTGPLGHPVAARWLDIGDEVYVESAEASGLTVVGGAGRNDPVAASSRGTGELILAAIRGSGAEPAGRASSGTTRRRPRRVVVGLGGSATTDGGLGALRAIEEGGGMGTVELVGACDVLMPFADALRFAAQKGAHGRQLPLLARRLGRLAQLYRRRYGVDVAALPGAGAAGGIGGAIAALGGTLRSGFEVVAERLGLADALAGTALVVTGEGRFDATSFTGKVVGGVLEAAREADVPVLVVAGEIDDHVDRRVGGSDVRALSLAQRYGDGAARAAAAACLEETVADELVAFDTCSW